MSSIQALRPRVVVAALALALTVAAPADSATHAARASQAAHATQTAHAAHVAQVGASAPRAGASAKTMVVARSTLAETRVWLTVRRTSRYDAVMRVHMSVLRHRTWHPAGSLRVGPVFWYVVTRRGGLCAFSTGESAPSHRASPPVVATRRVVVQPLVTPAVGCGKARSFHYHRGELVRDR